VFITQTIICPHSFKTSISWKQVKINPTSVNEMVWGTKLKPMHFELTHVTVWKTNKETKRNCLAISLQINFVQEIAHANIRMCFQSTIFKSRWHHIWLIDTWVDIMSNEWNMLICSHKVRSHICNLWNNSSIKIVWCLTRWRGCLLIFSR
jgi:hypothetical protein